MQHIHVASGGRSQFRALAKPRSSQFGNIVPQATRGTIMSSNGNFPGESDTGSFSFGVRELRQAQATPAVALRTVARPVARENRGADPYNTSGSFDRKKNWARVGRR
jgi:hypothetical protein